jgi:hypothetical protein
MSDWYVKEGKSAEAATNEPWQEEALSFWSAKMYVIDAQGVSQRSSAPGLTP